MVEYSRQIVKGSPTTIDNGLLICAYVGSPIGGLLLLRIAETFAFLAVLGHEYE